MKRWIIVGVLVGLSGVSGFVAAPFIMPAPPQTKASAADASGNPQPVLYNMPLGKFTLRVTKRNKVLYLVLDVNVYIQGATEFERMNGAVGRARLRDGTISAVSDIAEDYHWIDDMELEQADKRTLAEQIVRKLHTDFPMVVTARINEFTSTVSLRE
ncbi:hypothetical protein [Roseovarius indicus]|uniref:Flagellar protein FliL n=2 Tax=Roseovarius indicus TaxID=540747 RepID=A0A0T5PC87_9RHOB|nr:hypothetical protein [Roseovarius indicus]KRS18575.1 hypothetical protein XM52_07225 [Roseovarius indicus]OAN98665.1 hypothetical protein A8B76_01075 [Roseovarius indicus]